MCVLGVGGGEKESTCERARVRERECVFGELESRILAP